MDKQNRLRDGQDWFWSFFIMEHQPHISCQSTSSVQENKFEFE